MVTKKTTRSARTRKEVQDEFSDVSRTVRAQEALPASEKAIQETRNATIRESVKGVTVDTAIQALTTTSLNVQKTFSSLSELITQKVTELNELQEAVALERAELEKLHGADIINSDLAALIAEHDAEVQTLEAEITQMKLEWQDEKELHEKVEAERIAELTKVRTREEQDFKYNQAQARKKDQDQWLQETVIREREVKLKNENLEKGWTERETKIVAQEKTFADLQAQVVAFPEVQKKEVDKHVAIATSSLKKELTGQFALEKKDLESSLQLRNQEIVGLKATGAAYLEQIGKLQIELASAQERVRNIAEKALESASGARALSEIQSFQSRERDTGNGRKA